MCILQVPPDAPKSRLPEIVGYDPSGKPIFKARNATLKGTDGHGVEEWNEHVPRALRRRLCPFCGDLMGNKRRLFQSNSVIEHLNSSECHIVKLNVSCGEDGIQCEYCDHVIAISKTSITTYIDHLCDHNAKIHCVFCREKIDIINMYRHILSHANELKMMCKRCHKDFPTGIEFYDHLIDFHQVAKPNVATIEKYVADSIHHRSLAIMSILVSKYEF